MYKFTIKAGIFRDNILRPDLGGCTEYLIYANTAQEAFARIKEVNGDAGAWYEYRFKVLLVEEIQL